MISCHLASGVDQTTGLSPPKMMGVNSLASELHHVHGVTNQRVMCYIYFQFQKLLFSSCWCSGLVISFLFISGPFFVIYERNASYQLLSSVGFIFQAN